MKTKLDAIIKVAGLSGLRSFSRKLDYNVGKWMKSPTINPIEKIKKYISHRPSYIKRIQAGKVEGMLAPKTIQNIAEKFEKKTNILSKKYL